MEGIVLWEPLSTEGIAIGRYRASVGLIVLPLWWNSIVPMVRHMEVVLSWAVTLRDTDRLSVNLARLFDRW